MKTTVLERLSGTGLVLSASGEVLESAPYHLTIRRDGAEPPDAAAITGYIAPTRAVRRRSLDHGERLALRLEDGRHLPFVFVDPWGKVEACGPLTS
ncbi:MAG TPA: hypothetical protein VF210_11680 [Pseudomonadales bacterium]